MATVSNLSVDSVILIVPVVVRVVASLRAAWVQVAAAMATVSNLSVDFVILIVHVVVRVVASLRAAVRVYLTIVFSFCIFHCIALFYFLEE
jgi:hypothetical protein